jgi:sporulation protein YlmC with PRC-barrel domain
MRLKPLRDIAGADLSRSLDLRSWSVFARDGSALGTVAEVIIDVDTRTAVYLHIVPHEQPDDAPAECWICVLYRQVAIDEDARCVVMSDLALLGLGTATAGLATARAR